MSAERVPEGGSNRKVDLITMFQSAYADAIGNAKVGAEHTATDGWKALFHETRKSHSDRSRDNAKQLRDLADTIESVGSTEDIEKAIGDCKKVAESVRKDHDAFNRQVVEPIKAPALECTRLIGDYRGRAARAEEDAPLINVGLVHLMRDAIASVPKVEWDNEAGAIVIHEITDAAQ